MFDFRKTVRRLSHRQMRMEHERMIKRYETMAVWLIRAVAAVIAIGMIWGR